MNNGPKKEYDLRRLAGFIFLPHGIILCLCGLFSQAATLWNPYMWWGSVMLLFSATFLFWTGFERDAEEETF
ncbi:hypothetical protein ACI48J_22215 [Paenibacillus chitinolyticus]|uniref:hypothetical protein n=1 Tax=Paenibacillus chitinolyticus TaxID=79263 RepID=UPI002DBEA661|nr:hypothetical protein [Paenibacillus chitinolyticus]MEC0248153.1 hypothetical protein [Paenibacillus chitinolyticus]